MPLAGGARAKLPEVVESVYDCIPDTDRWQPTLETIRGLFDGHLATLGVIDTASRKARLMISCGDRALLEPLINDYAAEVPLYAALPRMEIDVPFTIDAVYALQGPDARQTWIDSRIAREWVVPNHLDDFFWVALMKQPTRVGTMMIVTHKDRHQITAEELRSVGLLAPAHAPRSHDRRHVRGRAAQWPDFPDHRRGARAPRADRVGGHADPVRQPRGRDDARRPGHDPLAARPAAFFLSAGAWRGRPARSSFGMRDEFGLGPAGINVPLARVNVPAVAHVLPLGRRDAAARMAHRAAAAIFIAAAGAAPLPALDAIAALFGLTAAEKRVAGHVAAGFNRTDIAAAAGVSDGTVKTQLAAIFDKTGAHDQRELELLIREAISGSRGESRTRQRQALKPGPCRRGRRATPGKLTLPCEGRPRPRRSLTARPRHPSHIAWPPCKRSLSPLRDDPSPRRRPGRTALGTPAPC